MKTTTRLQNETIRNGFSNGHLKFIFNLTIEEQGA